MKGVVVMNDRHYAKKRRTRQGLRALFPSFFLLAGVAYDAVWG